MVWCLNAQVCIDLLVAVAKYKRDRFWKIGLC